MSCPHHVSLDSRVDLKRDERDELKARMDEWEAKHGKPVTHPPHVSANGPANEYMRQAPSSYAKRNKKRTKKSNSDIFGGEG